MCKNVSKRRRITCKIRKNFFMPFLNLFKISSEETGGVLDLTLNDVKGDVMLTKSLSLMEIEFGLNIFKYLLNLTKSLIKMRIKYAAPYIENYGIMLHFCSTYR